MRRVKTDRALQRSLEAPWNPVHIRRHPAASMPDGPAEPCTLKGLLKGSDRHRSIQRGLGVSRLGCRPETGGRLSRLLVQPGVFLSVCPAPVCRLSPLPNRAPQPNRGQTPCVVPLALYPHHEADEGSCSSLIVISLFQITLRQMLLDGFALSYQLPNIS